MGRKIFNGLLILTLIGGLILFGYTLYNEYGYWAVLPIPTLILAYFIGSKVDLLELISKNK